MYRKGVLQPSTVPEYTLLFTSTLPNCSYLCLLYKKSILIPFLTVLCSFWTSIFMKIKELNQELFQHTSNLFMHFSHTPSHHQHLPEIWTPLGRSHRWLTHPPREPPGEPWKTPCVGMSSHILGTPKSLLHARPHANASFSVRGEENNVTHITILGQQVP